MVCMMRERELEEGMNGSYIRTYVLRKLNWGDGVGVFTRRFLVEFLIGVEVVEGGEMVL